MQPIAGVRYLAAVMVLIGVSPVRADVERDVRALAPPKG